jgi:uncharacterized protein (TIGR02466 family)
MIENLWPTPFLKTQMPDDIRESLLTRIFTDYDFSKPPSDFGTQNVLDNKSEEFRDFKNKVIRPAFDNFLSESIGKKVSDWQSHRMHGWLAGTSRDYSLDFHNHRGAQISAVFYILCEEQDKGGAITFTDPRMNANRGYDASFVPWFKHKIMTPKSGDIVVFPSFLYHFVTTYQSNIRIAIPVDLFLRTNK